jgi:hypothetical protein
LVAGLLYLQHAYDCSDEVAVNTWAENPYWQHYTGEPESVKPVLQSTADLIELRR